MKPVRREGSILGPGAQSDATIALAPVPDVRTHRGSRSPLQRQPHRLDALGAAVTKGRYYPPPPTSCPDPHPGAFPPAANGNGSLTSYVQASHQRQILVG